jgi:hypothetical protein
MLFFAANHQPSTSRLPQKSWPADGSANEKTASHSRGILLFSTVFEDNSKNGRGGTIAGNNCSESLGGISMAVTLTKEVPVCQFCKYFL